MSEPQPLRYFPNDGPLLKLVDSPRDNVLQGLTRLVTVYPPVPKTFETEGLSGLFAGPASVAYLFFKLSAPGTGYEDVEVEGKSLRTWAEEYLKCADETPMDAETAAELAATTQHRYGIAIDETVRAALRAAFYKDQDALKRFLEYLPKVLASGEGEVWNEHIYGRTGYLYQLRMIAKYWPEAPIPADTCTSVLKTVMDDGAQAWKFVGKHYLGAGHGWINVTTQILLADASYAAACKPIVQQILDEQVLDPSDENFGNWDAYVLEDGVPRERLMVQWGHGSPGMVISLMSIKSAYKDDPEFVAKIDSAIDNAQGNIWSRGILLKESCLCHGAAGNMLALKDRGQREHFMVHSTIESVRKGLEDGTLEASSSPSGLFRGLASRIWAFHMLETDGFACVGYNDL